MNGLQVFTLVMNIMVHGYFQNFETMRLKVLFVKTIKPMKIVLLIISRPMNVSAQGMLALEILQLT